MVSPAKRGSTPLDSPKGEKEDINRGELCKNVSFSKVLYRDIVEGELKKDEATKHNLRGVKEGRSPS